MGLYSSDMTPFLSMRAAPRMCVQLHAGDASGSEVEAAPARQEHVQTIKYLTLGPVLARPDPRR